MAVALLAFGLLGLLRPMVLEERLAMALTADGSS